MEMVPLNTLLEKFVPRLAESDVPPPIGANHDLCASLRTQQIYQGNSAWIKRHFARHLADTMAATFL
jgi:hypothetical protein